MGVEESGEGQQAQPGPFRHVRFAAMQVSPQGTPREHTLQQPRERAAGARAERRAEVARRVVVARRDVGAAGREANDWGAT